MNPDIRNKLKRIADINWDANFEDPFACVEQISYLIYLKLLDEDESNNEQSAGITQGAKNRTSLFLQQAERFRWNIWRVRREYDLFYFLRDEVFPYMASLVKEAPLVAEYFRDATFKISDPRVVEKVVDEIDSIEFRKIDAGVDGGIIECLLTYLGEPARGHQFRGGQSQRAQFRTPRRIRSLMVAMIDPDLGETIYDPACGTGGLLIDSLNHVLGKQRKESITASTYGKERLGQNDSSSVEDANETISKLQTYGDGVGDATPGHEVLESLIYGFDVSRQMTRLATMNLFLHGVRSRRVRRGDPFSPVGGLTEDDLGRRYNVILSNPGFPDMRRAESARFGLRAHGSRGEVVFLEAVMDALAPGGRCAVVVPEMVLFRPTKTHTSLREVIVENFDLLAVVSLPPGVFESHTTGNMAVLVFRRPRSRTKSTADKVWFYEIANDRHDLGKARSGHRTETLEDYDISGLLSLWAEFRHSGFTTPPGDPASILLAPDSQAPKSWWADLNILRANGYNLVARRYRPRIAEPAPKEDPADLIRECLDLERELTNGLKVLLSELEGR